MKHLVSSWAVFLLLVLWSTAVHAELTCPPVVTTPTPAQLHDAQQRARDRGALWRFERGGHHGYLYGTIHVGKLEWAIPGRAVSQALRDAEVIAMELNPADPSVKSGMLAPQRPQEKPEVLAPLLQRLRDQATKACVPWERLETLPPMMIATTLAVLDARWVGLDPSYGSEHVLAGFAKAAHKNIAMLETVAVQRRAIMGGSPAEQIAAIEHVVSGLESGAGRKIVTVLAEAWASGDLDRLGRYREWCECDTDPTARAAFERVVFERNPGLAARIEELHRAGRRVFAAMGILHMVGDSAVPKLLAGRGFKVERLALDGR